MINQMKGVSNDLLALVHFTDGGGGISIMCKITGSTARFMGEQLDSLYNEFIENISEEVDFDTAVNHFSCHSITVNEKKA